MEDLKLIYVLPIGENWKEEYEYEIIFSDTIKDIDGEDWDSYPASGKPSPPSKNFIKGVARITTDIKFDVIQNSELFSVFDAIDGVIALAWENIDGYDEYPEHRTCFRFGEAYKSVKDKLYSKDIILDVKTINYELER